MPNIKNLSTLVLIKKKNHWNSKPSCLNKIYPLTTADCAVKTRFILCIYKSSSTAIILWLANEKRAMDNLTEKDLIIF